MWENEVLIVPRNTFKALRASAFKTKSVEMCGVLIGWGTYGEIWWPIPNVHPDPEHHYQMDPDRQIRVWEQASSNGYRVVAVVHSHPNRDASLSTADIDYAAFGGDTFYAVLGMKPLELRAWTIEDKQGEKKVTPHKVEIDPAKYGLVHCYSHNRYEDSLRAFRRCFECGHVFATELELIAAHNDVVKQINRDNTDANAQGAQKAKDVFCCPFCVHDF